MNLHPLILQRLAEVSTSGIPILVGKETEHSIDEIWRLATRLRTKKCSAFETVLTRFAVRSQLCAFDAVLIEEVDSLTIALQNEVAEQLSAMNSEERGKMFFTAKNISRLPPNFLAQVCKVTPNAEIREAKFSERCPPEQDRQKDNCWER